MDLEANNNSVEAENIKGKKTPNPTFFTRIGGHEFFSSEMYKAAITELVASASFLFTASTIVIACLDSHENDPKFLIPIVIFILAFLVLIVTVPISGGHVSPVFAFMAALKGIISFVRCFFYVLGQCLGSIIAFFIMRSVMDNTTAHKFLLAGCVVNGGGEGVSAGTALIIEFTCTFLVLYIGITIAFDKEKFMELGLTMVCVIISAIYAVAIFVSVTVTGKAGYGGVGLNPARCLGPALFLGGPMWDGHWVFWVGPFCSCLVYYGFTLMLPKKGFVRSEEEQDIMQLVRSSCLGKESPSYVEAKV